MAEAYPAHEPSSRLRLAAGIALILVGGAVALGIALRVRLLSVGSLWLDELWTLDAITGSYPKFVSKLVVDQAPPLWTSMAFRWQHLTGSQDPAVLRSFSVLMSTCAVLAPMIGAARMPRLRPPLVLVAAFLALSLVVVQYAVEFRNYSFLIATSSVAVVIWSGLITQDLPCSPGWIVAFIVVGAIGGLAHYYGNISYGALLVSLAWRWRLPRRHRQLRFLVGWGAASFAPAVGWYLATRRWSPGQAVAAAPSLAELNAWLQSGFAPLTLVVDSSAGVSATDSGAALVVGSVLVLAVQALRAARRGDAPEEWPASVTLGWYAAATVGVGVVLAWSVSLLLPASMNVRNLSALLPALFLMPACAVTSVRHDGVRWLAVSLAVLAWAGAAVAFLLTVGVAGAAPAWHLSAGYRPAVEILVASQNRPSPPQLVGLKQSWDWHGDWDSALRSYVTDVGRGPAVEMAPIIWVLGPDDPLLDTLGSGDVIVFGFADDQRTGAVLDLLTSRGAACRQQRLGQPGYGNVALADCAQAG